MKSSSLYLQSVCRASVQHILAYNQNYTKEPIKKHITKPIYECLYHHLQSKIVHLKTQLMVYNNYSCLPCYTISCNTSIPVFGVVIVAHLFCFLCYVFVQFIFALCLVSIVACVSRLSIHDYPPCVSRLSIHDYPPVCLDCLFMITPLCVQIVHS